MSAIDQLPRWVHLMQQVHEARFYVDRATELGNPEQFRTHDGILEFLVYFRSALNSYAKCFVSSGAGKIRFESSNVFQAKAEYSVQHLRIMELRHKYVAHSDDNEFEEASVKTTETDSELVVALQYHFHFPFDRLYELRDLIDHLEEYVVDRHKKHIQTVQKEVGKTVRIREGE